MNTSPDHHITKSNFQGLTIVSFESRMAAEMTNLITRHGGQPTVVPALREIPLDHNAEALSFGAQLLAGQIDAVILLTGVGTTALVEVLRTRHPLETIQAALRRGTLIARGPKPVAALKALGLTPTLSVPEPNARRDVLRTLDEWKSVAGLRIAVQEYGVPATELVEGLRQRGATVIPVPVYRWAMPSDLTLLREALDRIMITNAAQIDHVMRVLERDGKTAPFKEACRRLVLASIGPTASERLRHYDLPVDLEPSHPKMGILVKETSERARELLLKKR
ncbi:MAG: uroporphyrinogen-III synthase [Nitrospirae bacterium]|nr:uroporphyrinogen-III synthase [Nitrospirota bacterium]